MCSTSPNHLPKLVKMTNSLPDVTRRLLVSLFGLLMAAGGLAVCMHALGLLGPLVLILPGFTLVLNLTALPFAQVLLWSGAALGAILAGLLLLAVGLMPATPRKQRIVLQRSGLNGHYGGGEVTIALPSLTDLAAYVAERVEGVREAHPVVRLKRKGWHVVCPITVAPDAALPDVAARLKTALQDALERHTGLPVTRVDIAAQLPAQDVRQRLK